MEKYDESLTDSRKQILQIRIYNPTDRRRNREMENTINLITLTFSCTLAKTYFSL